MKQKIINLQQKLAQGLVGREQTIKTALLSAVAGENVLLIGPPGTGKSMVSRRISQAIAPKEGASPYFEYLLTKFSTPEELFGPLSISALKQDRFERKTEGYLPDVQVAFLDEIFKASSSILNSLLTILNERKYHNGTESLDIPLQALVAASNELPKGQAELAALYDRFLLRCFVDYLDQNDLSRLFTLPQAADIAPSEQLTAAELADIQAQAREVVFPENIQEVLRDIWQQHAETFKEHADEQLSDRRFVKVLNLLRVSAATNGRSEVDLSDVMLLKDCLWNNDENREKVAELIRNELVKRGAVKDSNGQVVSHNSLIQKKSSNQISSLNEVVLLDKHAPGNGGDVLEIYVKDGDQVNAGDPVLTLETDKVVAEIITEVSGIVHEVKVKLGDTVSSGDVLIVIDTDKKNQTISKPYQRSMQDILDSPIQEIESKQSMFQQQITANIWL